MRSIFVLVVFVVVSNASGADFSVLTGPSQSGESLLALIKDSDTSNPSSGALIKAGNAFGYIQAVRDYNSYNRWNMIAVLNKEPITDLEKAKPKIAELFFCEPPTMSNGQILAIARKFLEQNPERWREHAFNLVQEAFKVAYPCKVENLFR